MSESTFEKELDENGYLCYKNVGTSMLPLIRQGKDVMIIEKKQRAIKKYDAVLYVRPDVEGRGKYILHRVLKVLPDNKFKIAGDNCFKCEIVNDNQIIGILKSVNRDGKQLDFNSLKYRAYVFLWCRFYHIRFLILRIKNLFTKLKVNYNKALHKLYLFYKRKN